MSFRRSKKGTREGLRWVEFRAAENDLFARAGLPGFFADRDRFDEFLMEAFSEMPGGLADGAAFSLDERDAPQREALGELVSLYLDRFPDPGVCRKVELLMPGSR